MVKFFIYDPTKIKVKKRKKFITRKVFTRAYTICELLNTILSQRKEIECLKSKLDKITNADKIDIDQKSMHISDDIFNFSEQRSRTISIINGLRGANAVNFNDIVMLEQI